MKEKFLSGIGFDNKLMGTPISVVLAGSGRHGDGGLDKPAGSGDLGAFLEALMDAQQRRRSGAAVILGLSGHSMLWYRRF